MPEVKILANGEEMMIQTADRFTVLVHQQDIRVEVPEFVEVNSRNTLDCMEKMSQKAWDHISSGQLFNELYRTLFPIEDVESELPKLIWELNKRDFGIIHGCGLIVLGCEALFEGKNLFFRNPENHLHPKAQRRLMSMVYRMFEIITGEDMSPGTRAKKLAKIREEKRRSNE